METGAVPVGVKTPPTGSCARQALAASEASCAVFGAGINPISCVRPARGERRVLTRPYGCCVSAEITCVGSSVVRFVVRREDIRELDGGRAVRQGSVGPCGTVGSYRVTRGGGVGCAEEGACVAEGRSAVAPGENGSVENVLGQRADNVGLVRRFGCNDTGETLFVQAGTNGVVWRRG